MTDISLNEDQAIAILTEGMQRGLYESLNGALPPDPAQRLKDATDLVSIAKTASKNGNKSDNVQTILFIAEVDQNPLSLEQQRIAEAVADDGTVMGIMKIDSEENNIYNGIDLASLSDGVIEGLIVGLDKYPPSEQVEADRKAYLAEKERRQNEKAGKSQDEPQGTTPQAAPEKAGEAAPEGINASSELGSQMRGGDGSEETARIAESDSIGGEDAGAFARAQAPETSEKGRQAKAKPVEEDGDRIALEEQLSLPIIKAHGVDITKLGSIPVSQIKFMIENPEGPPSEEEENKQMSITDREIEESAVAKDVKAVGGIAPEVSAPVREVSKADLGLEEAGEEEQASGISAERESLESQITGPTLKAFGQGRKNIPSIGINELRFMVEHPDGKVSEKELLQARSKDQSEQQIEKQEMVVTKEIPGPEEVKHFLTQGDDRTIAEAAKEVVIKSPPVEEVDSFEISDMKAAEKANKAGEAQSADKVFVEIDREEQKKNRAMEIVAKENFPIPPAYSDEEAPVFPIDVSLISRDDLFSLHAKYHAYEMRINYVLAEHEDEMNDYIQLRNYREAEVAKSIPFMGEDGKRNTNEFRDAQVRGDKEVLELGKQEHAARKLVTDLKVHQKNYHLCCERLSRQMSKYENEMRDAPR